MKRIKIVSNTAQLWPVGTSRVVRIFRHNGYEIKFEEARDLMTLHFITTHIPWSILAKEADDVIFQAFKDYWYEDVS